MGRRKPSSVRLSQEFEAVLSGIAPNQSAVIRALILIGADAVGVGLTEVESDLRSLLAEVLPDTIYLRLRELAEHARSATPGVSLTAQTTRPAVRVTLVESLPTSGTEQLQVVQSVEQAETNDPLASVGFDFE